MRHGLLFAAVLISLIPGGLCASDTYGNPELAPDPAFAPANPWCGALCREPQPGACDDGIRGCGPYWRTLSNGCQPRYYVQAEALWLNRSRVRNINLAYEDDPDYREWQLASDDFSFDLTSGARIMIGAFLNPRTAIEGGYYGSHEWSESTEVDADDYAYDMTSYWIPGNAQSLLDTPSFQRADVMSATYSSRLHNAELGVRRWINPRTSLLFGVRYLKFEEEFALYALDADDGSAVYSIDTDNDLIGLQIGGEWTRPLFHSQRWFVAFDGRAGLFLNYAEQNSRLADNAKRAKFSDSTAGADRVGLASVLEMAVSLNWKVTDRVLLRGGYRAVFMTGLALAPDQLDTNPVQANSRQSLHNSGSVHLGGPFVGGEILLY